MNMEQAHHSGNRLLSAVCWFYSYVRLRLPIVNLMLPLAVTFPLSWMFYQKLYGQSIDVGLVPLRAWCSFVLLFMQLRLIDDLDDLQDDHRDIQARHDLKKRLLLLLALTAVTLMVLNFQSSTAFSAVIGSTLISYSGPFLIKRYLPPKPVFLLLGLLFFEGAPAAFFLYPYFTWLNDAPSGVFTLYEPIELAGTFWLSYEIWKFSRKVHTDAMQPYFLPKNGVRCVLNLLLVLIAVGLLNISAIFSPLGRYINVVFSILFLIWMNARWPADSDSRIRDKIKAPAWSGMFFLMAIELILSSEIIFEWVRT